MLFPSSHTIGVEMKKISIELVGSSDLTRLILNSVSFALVQNCCRRLFAELSCKLFENNQVELLVDPALPILLITIR